MLQCLLRLAEVKVQRSLVSYGESDARYAFRALAHTALRDYLAATVGNILCVYHTARQSPLYGNMLLQGFYRKLFESRGIAQLL
jgi:hypothetical protein